MLSFNPIYGPIASRRLGRSLGITTSKQKHCNHSCLYCQLGETTVRRQKRTTPIPVETIISALKDTLKKTADFDVITIAGNGEPTLYKPLETLIDAIRTLTDKPLAIITNAALFHRAEVRQACAKADLVLPTLNGYDERAYQTIHHPALTLSFQKHITGLIAFAASYKGALWLEIMLMRGVNDSPEALKQLKTHCDAINAERIYINTPVRTPANPRIRPCSAKAMHAAAQYLNGIAIDFLAEGYASTIEDDTLAVKSLIRHHPLHDHEIVAFLKARNADLPTVFKALKDDASIITREANGFTFYHVKS